MRRYLDTRLARVIKAEAPQNLTGARQRSLLRARAAVCTLLRERLARPGVGQALAAALQFGDAAAVELAGIPDTPELRVSDLALLARNHTGVEEMFETQLLRLIRQCDRRALDPASASPAELLAACVSAAESGGASGSAALG